MFILLFLLEKFRAFSVSCVNTVSVLSLAQTSEITLREFPLVIAAVAKVSRKRGLWLVVRVNKKVP